MSATTAIQWTDRTWNPTRGCSVVSPGCVNCYAMKQAHRFSGPGKPYEGLTKQTKAGPQWTGKVITVPDALREPLSWRKPQRVFVNSMSDLFHEDVPFEFIRRVFDVMAQARRHTFQILTKRAERMRDSLPLLAERHTAADGSGWPLPNVWLGVSAEDQQRADERIPLLLQTPAVARFVSIEPMLAPVDLTRLYGHVTFGDAVDLCVDALAGRYGAAWLGRRSVRDRELSALGINHLDWVIVGGESGPGARPFDLAWARSILQQCKKARVACFVKQIGSVPVQICSECGRTVGRVLGGFADVCGLHHESMRGRLLVVRNAQGGDPSEWPADLRVRQFPA